MVKVDTVYDI